MGGQQRHQPGRAAAPEAAQHDRREARLVAGAQGLAADAHRADLGPAAVCEHHRSRSSNSGVIPITPTSDSKWQSISGSTSGKAAAISPRGASNRRHADHALRAGPGRPGRRLVEDLDRRRGRLAPERPSGDVEGQHRCGQACFGQVDACAEQLRRHRRRHRDGENLVGRAFSGVLRHEQVAVDVLLDAAPHRVGRVEALAPVRA